MTTILYLLYKHFHHQAHFRALMLYWWFALILELHFRISSLPLWDRKEGKATGSPELMLLWCDPGLRMAAGEPDPLPQQPPLSHSHPQKLGGQHKHILLAALFTPRHKQLKQNHNEKRINKEKKSLPFIWLEKFSFSCINLSEWGTAKESPDNVLFSRKFTFSRYWM